MPKYQVQSSFTRGGEMFSAGTTVEMDAGAARKLVEAGLLAPQSGAKQQPPPPPPPAPRFVAVKQFQFENKTILQGALLELVEEEAKRLGVEKVVPAPSDDDLALLNGKRAEKKLEPLTIQEAALTAARLLAEGKGDADISDALAGITR